MSVVRRLTSEAGGRRVWCWRAHQHGAAGKELNREQTREPRLNSPDDALVRVIATSVNPIDFAMINGYGSFVLKLLRTMTGGGDEFPLVVGRDVVGVVERGPRCGQTIWGSVPPQHSGAMSQLMLMKESWIGPAPTKAPSSQSAAIPFAGLTAASAARIGGMAIGERGASAGARVLLYGLGGVGELLLQLLHHAGASVVAVCGSQPDTAGCATAVLDRRGANLSQEIRDLGPYDAVFDCAGLGGEFASSLPCDARVYVTLSSPLLSQCDARGLLCGMLASAGQLARQTAAANPTRVRWAYYVPCTRTLSMLQKLVDAGELRATVQVHSWLDDAWLHQAGGRKRVVLFSGV